MKTILILASILTLQFMIATNDVDAQNKKSSLAEITDAHMPEALARQLATDDRFERNKSCQLCGSGEPYNDLTTRSVDLNGDGNPEWLMSYCGNRTCSGWIYRKVGNRYESIMSGYIGDISYIRVPGTSSNGYRDLRNDDGGAFALIFRFDGKSYRATECLRYKVTYSRNGDVLRRAFLSRGRCPK